MYDTCRAFDVRARRTEKSSEITDQPNILAATLPSHETSGALWLTKNNEYDNNTERRITKRLQE
jgi:hypothetical protein